MTEASRPPVAHHFSDRLVRRFHFAAGLNGTAFGLEISALPLYFLTLNLPPAAYGLLVGTAWLVSVVVRVPIGALALRLGNRPLLRAGCLGYAPLSWALLLSGNVPLFFAIRLANGVARSLMILPLRSWFVELCPRQRLAAELGHLNAWHTMGQQLLGLFFGPIIISFFGAPVLLWMLGLMPLAVWWLVRDAPPDHPAASAAAAAGQGQPGLLWIAAPCGLASTAATTAIASFFPLVVRDLSWPTEMVGLVLLIQGLFAVILARQNGRIVGRWGERAPLVLFLVLVAISAATLYLVPGGLILPLVAALAGAASGTLPTIALGMAARSFASRSQGVSVHETYVSLGLGAGPFLGGLATTWFGTPRAAMLGSFIFSLAGLVALAVLQKAFAPQPSSEA
jgi:MFS family permease